MKDQYGTRAATKILEGYETKKSQGGTSRNLNFENAADGSKTHSEILRDRRASPVKSPGRMRKNNLIEEYQDFTVKMGIVHPLESDLNQSPNADKSKDFNFK